MSILISGQKKRFGFIKVITQLFLVVVIITIGYVSINKMGIGKESKVTFQDGTVIESCVITEDYEGFFYNVYWEEDGVKKRRKVPVENVTSIETIVEKRP